LTNAFGIYVHVPFCIHKCSYCDFYSFTKYSSSDFKPFITALSNEIRSAAKWLDGNRNCLQEVTSIFLGGGTPSLLPAEDLQTIFKVLREEFDWSPKIEITLEANPETVVPTVVMNWAERTPINRISMGAQSFQKHFLELLERKGSAEKITEAAALLKAAGFYNFNLDLIVGIPGQTSDQIQEDIEKAVALSPTHISNYNLSLKPGHPLFSKLPPDDLSADLYETARQALEQKGLRQYEVSNYAKSGFSCSHNLLYWSGGDFLGVGPSASSRFFWDGVFHHRKQISEISQYLKLEDFSQVPFTPTQLNQTQMEALFLEIRKNDGINLADFKRKYGISLELNPKLNPLIENGFLKYKEPTLSLTDKGRLLADSLVCELL